MFKSNETLNTTLERGTSQYCDYLYIIVLFEHLYKYNDNQIFTRFKKDILSVKKDILSVKKDILSVKKDILSVKERHFISEKRHN